MSLTQPAEVTHIVWESPALLLLVLASALLLRRLPLTALALLLGGSLAVIGGSVGAGELQPLPTSALLFAVDCVAGLEICYVAATRTRKVSATGAAMVGVSLLIALVTVPSLDLLRLRGGFPGPGERVVPIAVTFVTIIAWLIGNSIRQAHARAELVRAQAAEQTTLAERLRIARELHDIVAHSIGIIAIQAGAGHLVFDASPPEARDALAAIESMMRNADRSMSAGSGSRLPCRSTSTRTPASRVTAASRSRSARPGAGSSGA